MKTFALLVTNLLFFFSSAQAANYYLSSSTGNDSRTPAEAQNPATPWKTLAKLNAFATQLQPGDFVFFNRGDQFSGSLTIAKSGSAGAPITFSAYGSGHKPVISGLTEVTQWTSKGKGIWESNCPSCSQPVGNVMINGKKQRMGRYPNEGFLTIGSHSGKTQISDAALSSAPDWTGGEVVIRTNRWIIDRNLISQHTGNTLRFAAGSEYEPTDNYGYFIQNHPGTFDTFGEWAYSRPTKTLSVFFGSDNPSSYKTAISTVNTLVTLKNLKHVTFEKIAFAGSNRSAFTISDAQHIVIRDCDILNAATDGIIATNTKGLRIENNLISDTNNNALICTGANTTVRNNVIKRTGTVAGMGQSGNHNYEAVNVTGSSLIEYNRIDSTGYIPVKFQGDSVYIQHNFINTFATVKDDAGGIYSWTGARNTTQFKDRVIKGNIVVNGTGATAGTNSATPYAFGIYLDDNTSQVQVLRNTVANCAHSGIYLHNASSNTIKSNTLYNNTLQQMLLVHDDICVGCPMKNNEVADNVLFSREKSQLTISAQTNFNDIHAFGNFNANYHSRPLGDNFSLNTVQRTPGSVLNQLFDLQTWQKNYALESNSKNFPIAIPPYTISKQLSENLYRNGKFDQNIKGLYDKALDGNSHVEWEASALLDGGSLKWSYSSIPNKVNKSYLVLEAGEVKAGRQYLLRVSTVGIGNNQIIGAYIRRTNAPYDNITENSNFKVSANRQEHTILFTPSVTEKYSSIGFQLQGGDGTVWLDNIELSEAEVLLTKAEDFLYFDINPSKSAKTVTLKQSYVDAKNKSYTGNVLIPPYSSLVLVKSPASPDNKTTPQPLGQSPVTVIKKSSTPVMVYPNPAADFINVHIDNEIKNGSKKAISIEIINRLGKTVLLNQFDKDSAGNIFKLGIEDLQPGIYFIRVRINQAVYNRKFIKTI